MRLHSCECPTYCNTGYGVRHGLGSILCNASGGRLHPHAGRHTPLVGLGSISGVLRGRADKQIEC